MLLKYYISFQIIIFLSYYATDRAQFFFIKRRLQYYVQMRNLPSKAPQCYIIPLFEELVIFFW